MAEGPLHALVLEHEVDRAPAGPQPGGDRHSGRSEILAQGDDDVLVARRQIGDEPLVHQQLHDDHVTEAEAGSRHVVAAEARQQPVVAPAAADGAKLPGAVVRLEDGSGVVGEAAHHRCVEGHPVCDAVGIDEVEQRCQFRYRCTVAAQCCGERVEVPEAQSRLDGGHCISAQALLCQLCGHYIVGKLVHLVDDDAGRSEGVS